MGFKEACQKHAAIHQTLTFPEAGCGLVRAEVKVKNNPGAVRSTNALPFHDAVREAALLIRSYSYFATLFISCKHGVR